MGILLTTLTRFVGTAGKAFKVGGNLHQVFAGIFRTLRMGLPILGGFIGMIGGAFLSVIGKVVSIFQDAIKEALGFELSIKGLLEQAEKARKYYSELGDELNYFSDKTGSTAEAQKILMHGFKESAGSMSQVKTVLQSMVDAGGDNGKVMKNLIADLVDLEIATGVAGTTFSQTTIKFQQMFKKSGVEKDVMSLQKAIAGTGLRTTNLEQTLNGLTESVEKLAFATRGETLDFMTLGKEYGKFAATLKNFGINTQVSSNFINNLLDPENIDKNMLLLNKLGYSYEEYNRMINTGKGQEVFFDKILNNIGQVASEANMIEDAATRYKYLKETLGLPPEIANKLLNLEPYALREEVKRIKKEMEEAEKRKKIKDSLKRKEEKYQEQLDFIRFNMVAPLMDFIIKNRKTMMEMMTALTPVIQGLSKMLNEFLVPFTDWFSDFNKDLTQLNKDIENLDEKGKADKIAKFVRKSFLTLVDTIAHAFINVWNSEQVQGVIIPIAKSLGRLLRIAMKYATGNVFGKKGWDQASQEVDDDDKYERYTKTQESVGGSRYVNKEQFKKFKIGDKYISGTGSSSSGSFAIYDTVTEKNIEFLNNQALENTKKFINANLQQKVTNGKGGGEMKKAYEGYEADAEALAKAVIDNNENLIASITEKMIKNIEGNYTTGADGKKIPTKWGKSFVSYLEKIKKNLTPTDLRISGYENVWDGGTNVKDRNITDKEKTALTTVKTKLSESDFKEAMRVINASPQLLKIFGEEFASKSSKQLAELQAGLTNKDKQITSLTGDIATLNKKITDMENSPIVKILKEIRDAFIGTGPDMYGNYSVKELLAVVADGVDDTAAQYSSKVKSGAKNSDSFSKQMNVNQASENAVLPASGSAGWVIVKNTTLDNIFNAPTKNLAVKQTLFLKAIAESTYSTAHYTRLLSYSLIYTQKGLAVYLPQLEAGSGGSSGNNLLGYSNKSFNSVRLQGAKEGGPNPFAVMAEKVVVVE